MSANFNTGAKVKYYIQERGESVATFANKIGLPVHTIHNIIYGKSKKKNNLRTVARHLDVPLAHLLCSKIKKDLMLPTSGVVEDVNFDSKAYTECLSIVTELCKHYVIDSSKDMIEEYAHDLYLYKNAHSHHDVGRAFVEGMIQVGLKNMILTPESGTKSCKKQQELATT
jgi:hypothetical protein